MTLTTTIPYEDYAKLTKDSADKENIIKILNTEFDDDKCRLIAIKAILGIKEKTEEEINTPELTPEVEELVP